MTRGPLIKLNQNKLILFEIFIPHICMYICIFQIQVGSYDLILAFTFIQVGSYDLKFIYSYILTSSQSEILIWSHVISYVISYVISCDFMSEIIWEIIWEIICDHMRLFQPGRRKNIYWIFWLANNKPICLMLTSVESSFSSFLFKIPNTISDISLLIIW